MRSPFDRPFEIKDKNREIPLIENIRKVVSQINVGKEDYKKVVKEYFKFFDKQIKTYLGKDYFLITVYYSYLIPHLRVTFSNENVANYEEALKTWYDTKFNNNEKIFSLVPISLKSHKLNKPPQKYCLILSNPNERNPLEGINEINISNCYANSELWNYWETIIKKGTENDFDKVNKEINENSSKLNIDECLNIIKTATNKYDLEVEHITPFILTWFSIHEKWPYHYYIPSPMLSNTPVGGIVVGAKKSINEKELLCLEDIALKVTVNINSLEHKEKVMQQSRRTAVVAVMGRNMSHNIGSHVLWHLAQTPLIKKEISKEDIEKQNGFYNYIRERMGFIGLISTTSPSWVLEYDFSKIINDFKNQALLLQNLVKTEKKDLTIKIIHDNNCKKNIELPHGSYGAHAFFTILENIIRNTVKHNIAHVNTEITFKISIEEDSVNYKDYFVVKITDDLKKYSQCLDVLITDLNSKTLEKIVDEDGKLTNKHLGFKEKRIGSAFLRLIPQESIDCKFEPPLPPLLKVEKNNGNLTHVIYVKKPKKALIVTENNKILTAKDDLLDKGFYVGNKDSLLNIIDFTHQFLVLDFDIDSNTRKFIETNKQRLPFRILEKGDYNNNSIPPDTNQLDLFLWKTWLTKYFKDDDRKDKKIKFIMKDIPLENFAECKDKIERVKDDDMQNGHIVIFHDNIFSFEQDIYKKAYCIEGMKGVGGDGLFEMISNIKTAPFLLYKLLESFLFKIVIIDERVYEKADIDTQPQPSDKWNNGNIKFSKLWEKRQVWLINHDKIINNNWECILDLKPDILIIHLGVIDKYKDIHKDEFGKKWEKIKQNIKYIIIDSDRGRSDDIKEMGARWLQFSDLSNVVIDKAGENIAKYLLVNMITSVRNC